MIDEETIKVTRADFESVGKKLEHFVSGLTPAEQEVMAGIMQLAAGVQPWWNPVVRLHYKPRGGKEVVFGGADGLLVLFGYHGFRVVHPEGPLPTELPQFLGATLVVGEEEHLGA
jgi:hypothetical protein